MNIDHDLHIHTYLSACCQAKERQIPRAILTLAEEMGVNTLGFADHTWVNPNLTPSEWYRPQDQSQTERLRADLKGIATPVRVLVGCEAETVAPGKFGITHDFAASLDFVLLACSHFHMRGFVEQPASEAPRDVAEHLLTFFRSGVTAGLASSIAHPFVPLGYLEQFDAAIASISAAEFSDTFGLAAEHGVAIEVTTAFLPPPKDALFSIETPVRLLTAAREAGCAFTFGTDAHSPEAQMRLPELSALADAVGITETDVWSLP